MELYREGYLNKAGKGIIQTHLHSWRPRYFVLDGSSLKYYKTKEITPENMLGHILLSEVESICLIKNEKNSFQITTKSPKSRTYYMSGKSEEEVMGWIRVLEMAKAKVEKRDTKNAPASEISLYDDVKSPSQSQTPPAKPKRSPVVPSEYSLLGGVTPPQSTSNGPSLFNFADPPKTNTCPDKPIPSEYELLSSFEDSGNQKTENGNDEGFSEDPTYDKVDSSQSESSKQTTAQKVDIVYDEPRLAAIDSTDLYDTIQSVSDRKRATSEPPPLPSRHPTLSKETESETMSVSVYDVPHVESTKQETSAVSEEKSEEKKELEPMAERKSRLPVYAKPMRKKSSKKIINPAMIDIGEVSGTVEEESAGGRETLKRGMIEPIGDRFAVEEMKEFLDSCTEENNNINGRSEAAMVDFDVNQSESGFHVLKCFLEKYQ